MTIVLLLAIIGLYFWIGNSGDQKKRGRYVILCTLLLIFISGFRNQSVGNDTHAYIMSMERSVYSSWREIFSGFIYQYLFPSYETGKDPGFAVFEKIFSSFTTDSTIYLVVVAVITLAPIALFIYNNTRKTKDILFVYVFFVVMFFQYLPNSAIRQSIAIGLTYLAYLYLQKNKKIPFVIIIIIASTFHKTALIGLLLGLPVIKNPKLYLYAGVLVFFIIALLGNTISGFLTGFSDIYDHYAEGYFAQSGKQPPIIVLILFLGLYSLLLVKSKNTSYILEHRYFYIASALVLGLTPLVRIDPSYLRLISYFGLWFSILIADVLNTLYSKDIGKQIYTIIIMIFLIKTIFSPMNYKFNWQEMRLHDRYTSFIETSQKDTEYSLFLSKTYEIS